MMKSLLRFKLSTLLIVVGLFAVCCAWYVNQVSGQPSQKIMHVGGSHAMSPTITREYSVVDVNAYRHSKPERWHAVVMNPRVRPDGSTVAEVLRVVGLPGETVTFADGNVMINGQALTPPERLQKINSMATCGRSNPICTHIQSRMDDIICLATTGTRPRIAEFSVQFQITEIHGRVSSR